MKRNRGFTFTEGIIAPLHFHTASLQTVMTRLDSKLSKQGRSSSAPCELGKLGAQKAQGFSAHAERIGTGHNL